jgi:hypothetical protein
MIPTYPPFEPLWRRSDPQRRLFYMSSRARKILEEALSLPEEDRLLIAAELRGSVDAASPPEEVEDAWRDEVVRRLKSIEDGTAVLHEWEDVERELLDLVKS